MRRGAALPLLALLVLGCPGASKQVVYDLAARTPTAELWSSREVILFGTPAGEPHQAAGFYPGSADESGNRFCWSRREAEVSLTWTGVAARAAVVDLAPFAGVKGQGAKVSLNGSEVAHINLDDFRHGYRVPLPAAAQLVGDNRLRFVFAATASPAELDPKSRDKGQLAAAFYSMAVGEATDAGLDDLLVRDAPRPFALARDGGIPRLDQVGPSSAFYAIRLPEAAELRLRPVLHAVARTGGGAAAFRVSVEDADRPGQVREVWSRVLRPQDREQDRDVVVSLGGRAGDIVRLGLHVGAAPGARLAWGSWRAPRILGRGPVDPLEDAPVAAADDAKGDALRRSLAGMNVLFVILDAARAREVGAYGYERPTTPEIDRMAGEGVQFQRAFTPAVHTLGAMSSVWTSQPPERNHSEVSFSSRLPRDKLTLAEVLSGQGIHTAGFVANAVAGAAFGFDRGFTEFQETFRDYGSGAGGFRKVLPGWLEKNKGRRFFAYVHFREPHFPYDPEPPFDTRFGPPGPIPKAARQDMAWIVDVNQGRRSLTPEETAHLVRLYDGNLAFADQELGALRRSLEALGLWERTVVIVAADHGEQLYEHGWIGHNTQLFDDSMRVPLIVRYPAGKGPVGLKLDALVDLLDVAPTIADVFGVLGKGGSDREFRGRSLLPVIAGAPGKAAALSRTVWDRPRYGLRDARYKFVFDTRTGEQQLFDLETDPGETRSRAAQEPVRAAYYRQALYQWMARLSERGEGEAEAALTKEQRDNLCALGYITCR